MVGIGKTQVGESLFSTFTLCQPLPDLDNGVNGDGIDDGLKTASASDADVFAVDRFEPVNRNRNSKGGRGTKDKGTYYCK